MNPQTLEKWYRWEWYLLLAFVYSIPYIEGLKNILWGVLFASFLLRLGFGHEKGRWGWLETSVMACIGIGILVSFFAIEPSESWKGVWDLVRGGSVLWIASSHFKIKERRIQFVRHLVISTALVSLIGFKDFAYGRWILHKPTVRVQLPSVGHFNQSAVYLAMAWLAGLTALSDRRFFSRPWVGWISLLILGAALLGTTSRTCIAFGFGVGILLIFMARHSVRLVWAWMGSAVVGVLVVLTTPGFSERLFFRGSFASRLEIWSSAWVSIQKHPWLGVGLNNFKNIVLTKSSESAVISIDHAHNLFINTWAQAGSIGLLSLVLLTLISFWKICSYRKADPVTSFLPALGGWSIIFLVGTSHTTLHHEISILFFLLLALCNHPVGKMDSADKE